MRTKKDIQILLKSGLSPSLLSKLNESQLRVLSEKFFKELDKDSKGKKEETKEAWTEVTTSQKKLTAPVDSKDLTVPTPPPGKTQKVTVSGNTIQLTQNEGEMTEDVNVNKDNATAGQISQSPHQVQAPDGMGDLGDATIDNEENLATEGVIKEKFESQSQQNFFWAKCNTSKGVKKKKWCELAIEREFSDSTSKKQNKQMPEKKTNENLRKFIENTIVEILEKKVDAKMTKKELMSAIKKTKNKDESYILSKPKKMTMFSDEAPMELPISNMF